ncbi:MAG: hypothetical protein NTV88_00885 [Candidatus Micrarchaeota archaeon]|nr:hypothetical protein [Candidatus Micrarchaeota archaeon]
MAGKSKITAKGLGTLKLEKQIIKEGITRNQPAKGDLLLITVLEEGKKNSYLSEFLSFDMRSGGFRFCVDNGAKTDRKGQKFGEAAYSPDDILEVAKVGSKKVTVSYNDGKKEAKYSGTLSGYEIHDWSLGRDHIKTNAGAEIDIRNIKSVKLGSKTFALSTYWHL